MIKLTPEEIQKEYQKCVNYNTGMNLYETVKTNENFFNDKQWEGVNAPDLPKPVFNFLKPVINYYVAMIVSDDIAVNVDIFDDVPEWLPKVLSKEFEKVIENAKIKDKNREAIRDTAVRGDTAFYFYWNPDTKTGQDSKGSIECELIDNTNILFGNSCNQNVQEQPYIILIQRKTVDEVKKMAKANGQDFESIKADTEEQDYNRKGDDDLCTVLIKLYKENGTVKCIKTTKTTIIQDVKDTGLSLYPISYLSWERVKNSYHGMAAITGKIPNQIAVNKLYAMALYFIQTMAFPKIVYDSAVLPNGWDNGVGKAIGVHGNPRDVFIASTPRIDLSTSVVNIIDRVVSQTKDLMGASDAALGNVRPDNTSAIIAVQKAAAVPLELNKMDFYRFVEDGVRIIMDFITVYYGTRIIEIVENNKGAKVLFNFNSLKDLAYKFNISIGSAAYWSELMQVQTMDNLFNKRIVTDAITYLEGIPDKYINNKADLIENLRSQQEQMQQLQLPQEEILNSIAQP